MATLGEHHFLIKLHCCLACLFCDRWHWCTEYKQELTALMYGSLIKSNVSAYVPGSVMAARGYHTKHSKGNTLLRGHEHDSVIAAAASSAAVTAHTASPAATAWHAAKVADVVARGSHR